MPEYSFKCDKCNKIRDVQWKMKEHSELKDKQFCIVCGEKEYQVVSKLNFKLLGEGWFPAESDTYDTNWHGTSKKFLDDGKEDQKRIDDRFETALIKGEE